MAPFPSIDISNSAFGPTPLPAAASRAHARAPPTHAPTHPRTHPPTPPRTLLTRATSAVAPLHRLPCNGTNSFGYGFGTLDCQFDDIMGWLEAAEDAAAAAGIDVAR